jgi:predicted enzyme related to lactoylglutathione lyase
MYQEAVMSRLQLALNVSNLDEAVEFYSKLFATTPAKVKPGYANFAIDEPPLKLVLIQGSGEPGSLNHLGVEVFSTAEVGAAQRRLADDGLTTTSENGVCCYAEQEKVWVDGPDGAPWEIYTVLSDADTFHGTAVDSTDAAPAPTDDPLCCATVPESAARCC